MSKSSRHCRTFRGRPEQKGSFSRTQWTRAPSSVMRRAMMRPMSPEPMMTTFFPKATLRIFIRYWTTPAVYTPAGRFPGTDKAPRVRSRQPVDRMTASAWTSKRPRGVM